MAVGNEHQSSNGASGKKLLLRLYTAGGAPNSLRAVENLKAICRAHFADQWELEIVDVLKEPLRALTDDILVTPTLLKLGPGTKARIIGDLSDGARVLAALSNGEPV